MRLPSGLLLALGLAAFSCGRDPGDPAPQATPLDAGAPAPGPGPGADRDPPTTRATPPGGEIGGKISVSLSASEPASIHYTTDGSTPSRQSPLYTSPIPIERSTVLRFLGVDLAGNEEEPQRETYAYAPSVRYDEVRQKSIHNAYGRNEPLFDQLVYHRARSVELDLHTGKSLSPNVPRDWYVYHENIIDAGTSCQRLSHCLEVIAAFHRAVPRHEVVTLLVDLKDGFDADHAPADLDQLAQDRLGKGALFTPADLLAACPAASLRGAVTPPCRWPKLADLRGRVIVLVTGGTACQKSNVSDYGGTTPRARSFFMAPNVDAASCAFAAYATRTDVVFFNMDDGNLPQAKPVGAAGLVSRAYHGGLKGGFDTPADYGRAKDAGVHLVATNRVSYLADPFTILHTSTGWPFQCTSTCDPGFVEPADVFGVKVDSGDQWGSADSFSFLYDTVAEASVSWTAFVSTPSSNVEAWAKGCIMARESERADSPHFSVCRPADAHPTRNQWRTTQGGSTDSAEVGGITGLSDDSAFFVRLTTKPEGAGTRATGEASADGRSWKTIGEQVFKVKLPLQGVAQSSHGSGPVHFLYGGVTRRSTSTTDRLYRASTFAKHAKIGAASSVAFEGPLP